MTYFQRVRDEVCQVLQNYTVDGLGEASPGERLPLGLFCVR